MHHRVLQRQLKKVRLGPAVLPTCEAAWNGLLDHVSRAYADADQDRYLLERSLAISSREMQALYDDLQQASESRIASERNKLRAVISSLGAGLCTLDKAGLVVSINPEGERLLHCAEADVLGQCFFTLVHHAWAQHATGSPDAVRAMIASGQPYRDEDQTFARKDGTVFPVSYTLNPIREEDTLRGAVLVFFDITERRRAKEALQASEARYKQFVEHATDIIYRTDLEGRFTYGNPVGLRIIGYTEAEMVGQPFTSIIRPDYQEKAFHFYAKQFEERTQSTYFECPIVTKTGEEVWIGQNVQPVWQDERIVGFQAVARDITDKRRAEAALHRAKDELEERVAARTAELRDANQQLLIELTERKEAEHQIRKQATLLDHAQDAICVLDAHERIVYWNKSAERLYGWTRDEAVGSRAGTLLFNPANDQYAEARALVLADGEWTGDLRQITKDGTDLTVESRWTFVQGPGDAHGAILIVNTDITEKKVLEMQFLRAQRMESLGTLAGGIAHDLNNILGPILMSTQMLQMKRNDERSSKLLHTMERSIQRGADLVRQVLSFARGAKGERAPVPLKPLVAELAKILRDTLPRSIQIRAETEDDLWTVEGDVTQLHQALMNLCLNAHDAMPDGGVLDLAVRNVVLEDPYTRLHVEARAGSYVLVQVMDTGAGMPPEVLDKIFEPFYTTKEDGTGLGLSTALGIVTGHGGFINVYSEPGQGTCFKLYLPGSQHTTACAGTEPATGTHEGRGELVLVVDDEEPFREVTRQLLEEHGYRAITAHDGAEALDLYRQFQREIRAVITDVMMPTMDGRALIRALHALDPRLKVIAASGLSFNEDLAETTGVTVQAFLPKPYETGTLLTTLHRVLSGTDPVDVSPAS